MRKQFSTVPAPKEWAYLMTTIFTSMALFIYLFYHSDEIKAGFHKPESPLIEQDSRNDSFSVKSTKIFPVFFKEKKELIQKETDSKVLKTKTYYLRK